MTSAKARTDVWYVSATDPAEAIRVLRSARHTLAERARVLDGALLGRWPGYEIRVYVSGAALLLNHEEHGREIYEIAVALTREGRRAGIRLDLQWSNPFTEAPRAAQCQRQEANPDV